MEENRSGRVTITANGASILIVEDEYAVARGIQYALKQEGYEVTVARNGEEGLESPTRNAPDLVILDVRLPGMDGFEMLRRLRGAGNKAPVLFLTARDEEMDKVIGLELGADDYLTKPFGLRELMSRIKALLRRAYGDLADAAGGRVIRHRDLLIDLERRRVQRGDRRISLTATEFEILRHLASQAGPRLHAARAARAGARLRGARPGREDDQRPRQPPAREAGGRPVRSGVHPDHPRCRLRLRRTLDACPEADALSSRASSPDSEPASSSASWSLVTIALISCRHAAAPAGRLLRATRPRTTSNRRARSSSIFVARRARRRRNPPVATRHGRSSLPTDPVDEPRMVVQRCARHGRAGSFAELAEDVAQANVTVTIAADPQEPQHLAYELDVPLSDAARRGRASSASRSRLSRSGSLRSPDLFWTHSAPALRSDW